MNNFSTNPTRMLLDRLGYPDKKLKIIHIAGTNGKGSTAEFFTEILIAAGKRVGTFTSPLVYDFYDQFRINGQPIQKDKFDKYLKETESLSDGASEFEVQTAAVINAFARESCEWAVVECGMGGLTDATNAISHKELAVITSISLEHTEYLGKTIEEICAQKAGIIKNNCPAVGNCIQLPEAKKYLKNIGVQFTNGITYNGGKEFWYYEKRFELSTEGEYQPYNAATAIVGAGILGISESAIYDGVKNTKPAGRLQVISAGWRNYILDGAHNPAAFTPLRDYLKNLPPEQITIIFGCLSDKDIDGNLKTLAGLSGEIIAVECPSSRTRGLEETASACKKYFKNVKTAKSVTEALDTVYTKTAVVCGTFTILKEAKLWIEKKQ